MVKPVYIGPRSCIYCRNFRVDEGKSMIIYKCDLLNLKFGEKEKFLQGKGVYSGIAAQNYSCEKFDSKMPTTIPREVKKKILAEA